MGLLDEVREFLAGLRRELPELAEAPARPRRSDRLRELFEARVRHWSGAMGVSPRRVCLKSQRTLWGSCSERGNVNFNRALAGAPAEVLDYVVIHELAHLREMNHSHRFWAVVEAWCPDQKRHRRWLRENSELLRCP
ncbi:MAG: M48 family metallopeptidase [Elusimicrobia bacterium]|nr:M48 family metallopeptidase [Elusimicrobiota bacterium]